MKFLSHPSVCIIVLLCELLINRYISSEDFVMIINIKRVKNNTIIFINQSNLSGNLMEGVVDVICSGRDDFDKTKWLEFLIEKR